MIFYAKNLTSNAGLFLLLENAKGNGIFQFIKNDLVFDNDSINIIKMNHIKTMLCGHFIGVDNLERLKLRQNDPLIKEFDTQVKESEVAEYRQHIKPFRLKYVFLAAKMIKTARNVIMKLSFNLKQVT